MAEHDNINFEMNEQCQKHKYFVTLYLRNIINLQPSNEPQ